ncbi:MAG TPA: DsbA family protein [Balneolaceae bacterium]|nr:DsbA family protein [Balneolaceae bacterium]
MSTVKPTLIYVYDPLCGWCYGFHPVMEKLQKRFGDQVSIEVKVGGLAVGERAQTINEGFSYIKDGLQQVEKSTGIEFGRNFRLLVDEGSYMYDSMPPCRAQKTMNELAPEKALQFAGTLQEAIFRDGKNLNDWSTYEELISDYDVDHDEFKARFESDELRDELIDEFTWCRNHGATGFPSLLIKIGNEISIMARGYRPFDTVESHLHHLIRNLEKIGS